MLSFVENQYYRLLKNEKAKQHLINWVLHLQIACFQNDSEKNSHLEVTTDDRILTVFDDRRLLINGFKVVRKFGHFCLNGFDIFDDFLDQGRVFILHEKVSFFGLTSLSLVLKFKFFLSKGIFEPKIEKIPELS